MVAYVRRIRHDGREPLKRRIKNKVPDFHMPQIVVAKS